MFTVVTSTLPGVHTPAVAIAGSRAGGTGILDLTLCLDSQLAKSGLEKLGRYGGENLGFRIDARPAFLKQILVSLPSGISTAIVVPSCFDSLPGIIRQLRKHDLTVILECTSLQEAQWGKKYDVDALIVKGHESGGRVGNETAFVLLQKVLAICEKPVWVQGGIGLHTAAACHIAGAAGVVLDAQLCLAREASLLPEWQQVLRRQDGRATFVVGEYIGDEHRLLSLIGNRCRDNLLQMEQLLLQETGTDGKMRWRHYLKDVCSDFSGQTQCLMVGQDVGLAGYFADCFVTVGGIVQAVHEAVSRQEILAAKDNPFASDGAMARDLATGAGIVQGPMARVSDKPEFSMAVAENGGLPFLAAAWLRQPELDALLADTGKLLGDAPWGIGLLGFLPSEVYAEQLQVVIKYRPPFALLAGGQPRQVRELEEKGIKTYVHVPTVSLLAMFLDGGVRRFIFEGREAGGHVGPFCSFVLWETMIRELLVYGEKKGNLDGIHVLFAGGIRDNLSASMIAVMAAPLVAAGAGVGLQVGSAYLFTEEAIRTGAIVPSYQQELLQCSATTLLETGPGHAVRCVETPFAKRFQLEKKRLLKEGVSNEEIRKTLERMELGRLRIAAKGVNRSPDEGLVAIDSVVQHEEGIYMIGQMAGLQETITTIGALHQDLAVNGYEKIREKTTVKGPRAGLSSAVRPSDIAIIGMAGFFPQASDTTRYWNNIVNKVCAIREIPKERWDYSPFFNEDPQCPDRIYSKWGTFLDDIPFDPVQYGMPPRMVPSVEPLHLLSLKAVRHALKDAGYEQRPFDRQRTAVAMGISGSGDLAQLYGFRTMLPMFFGENGDAIADHFKDILPQWTEDSFPGILMNVAAGRIANRFDFGGMNTLVDGACASSLAAVYTAVKELETNACDMAIVGGADCMQNPFTYMCFSKTHALSPRGVCNSLDARADGIVIGESIVTVVLKRMADAERDGDRIYAVIKGMGASSDGRDRSLTAPGIRGQVRALERAYQKAGVSPAAVTLIEGHATGTVEGDKIEIESVSRALNGAGCAPRSVAMGSVKSMIGHTKSAAGLASLVKTAMALHHKVLPPTLGVEIPNPGLQKEDSPLYANTETRPWFSQGALRRAGISAFGFGGTNYHGVLEEYGGNYYEQDSPASYQQWPTELFCWQAGDRKALGLEISKFVQQLHEGEAGSLVDLAQAAYKHYMATPFAAGMKRLVLIAASPEDLFAKIDIALGFLAGEEEILADPRGVFYTDNPLGEEGEIAFLFPGQGSQYVGMLSELAVQYPWIRQLFDNSDHILADRLSEPLTSVIFPASVFSDEERTAQAKALAQTNVAQPALGTADLALYNLCRRLNILPDMVGGHSYGEYVALCAAGVVSEKDLIAMSEARARFILQGTGSESGTMAAVEATVATVESVINTIEGVWIANINGPDQVVITGTDLSIRTALDRFEQQEIKARSIPVSCAFHSPLIEPACGPMASYLNTVVFAGPTIPVFSNTTAQPHGKDTGRIKDMLVEHLVNKVRFVDQINNMYAAGARIFVECGPGRVLSGLTGKILHDRPHLAVVTNQRGRSAFSQLQFALAELLVHGVACDLACLFEGRVGGAAATETITPTTWLVNGSRVRPATEAAKPVSIRPFQFSSAAPAGLATHLPIRGDALPVATHLSDQGKDSAPAGFQRLMRRFLDTQQQVMTRYLNGQDVVMAEEGEQTQSASEIPPMESAVTTPIIAENENIDTVSDPQSQLMAVVSERTGYPPEMIDLDSDMEAELGIDSIKRVEILGVFLKSLGNDKRESDVREKVEKARTLRQILEAIGRIEKKEVSLPGKNVAPALNTVKKNGPLGRCVVTVEQVAVPSGQVSFPADHTVVITSDGHGIAEGLATKFREMKVETVIIRGADEEGQRGDWHEYTGKDWLKLAAVIQKKHGPVGGLIHLAPLRPLKDFALMDCSEWRQRLVDENQTLFYLLQQFGDDLRASDRAVVAAVTGMGGCFALDSDRSRRFFPGHGAMAGFMKTIDLEWPEVRVRAIDIDPQEENSDIVASIFLELFTDDDRVEVGHAGGKRFALSVRLATLDDNQPHLQPDRDWVIVATGGGRGITARIVLELAKHCQPTIILVGRTSPPEASEDAETCHLESKQQLQEALIAKAKQRKEKKTITEIEKSCQRILAAREIRNTMAVLQDAGSRVVYRRQDVADGDAFTSFLTDVHQEYGRLDGIIHGAGIIEDKLFVDKKWDSFARVFFTKVQSTLGIVHALNLFSPRFVAFFSSVAGVFGNRGQCDYAAANEVMNKTALWLQSQKESRIVALNWGPWAGSGMASPEVQEQFRKRRVDLVGQDEGAAAFVREIEYGAVNEVSVLQGDGPWVTVAAQKQLAVLLDSPVVPVDRGGLSVSLHLATTRHRYLQDHCMDGRPVLPAAMAVEIMAEAASLSYLVGQVISVNDVRVLKGIVIEQDGSNLTVIAMPGDEKTVTVKITENGGERIFYSGTVCMGNRNDSSAWNIPESGALQSMPMTCRQLYDSWLFHGPLFQCITAIEGISEQGMRATLQTSLVNDCLADNGDRRWIFDPVVLDGGLQMALIWARHYHDITVLPSAIKAVHLFCPFVPATTVSCQLEVVEIVHAQSIVFSMYFYDDAKRPLAMIERVEATGSKELNRVAGLNKGGEAQ